MVNGLPGSVGAVLELTAYAPAGRADQRVVVRAGGRPACRLRLGAAPQRFHVAWAENGDDRSLVVLLETPDAVSPTEAGVGDDGLARGVHLAGVAPIWPVAVRATDAYVAVFHDQGHIPVKLLAPRAASALSIGAGVLFSSVGHGSAFDIAGRGVADPAAALAALALLGGSGPPIG